MEDYRKKLKEIIKNKKEEGIYQQDIAESIGISPQLFSQKLNKPDPPLYIFLKALNFLKIPYIEFFSNPDDLKNYIPSFLDGNDLKIAEMITGLNEKTRMEYKELCLRMARLLIDRSKDI